MRRHLAGLAITMSALTVLGACSDDGSNEQRDAIAQATPVVAATVRYGTSGFVPASVTIKQGESIVLANGDATDHRFRTTPAALDSGALRAGEQVTWLFPTVAEYQVTADSAVSHLTVTVQAKS